MSLPEEIPSTALVLAGERSVTNPRARLDVELAQGRFSLALTDADFDSLVAGQLYIGLYNLSDYVPSPDDFDGLDKSPGESRAMYGDHQDSRPGRRAMSSYRGRRLLGDGHVARRLGSAPLHMRECRGTRVLSGDVTAHSLGWVTHFVIGTHRDGVLMAGQFNAPLAIKPGNGFSFGIKMEQLRAALSESSTLPITSPPAAGALPAGYRESATKALTEGETSRD
jgi:hypothetical protein